MAINYYPGTGLYVPKYGAYLSATTGITQSTWNTIPWNTASANYSAASAMGYISANGGTLTANKAGMYNISLTCVANNDISVGIYHSTENWVAIDRINTALGAITVDALVYMAAGATVLTQAYPYNTGTTLTGGATNSKYTIQYVGM